MLLDVIRGDKMKTLTWKPILSNLEEANGELRRLHWQLHYLTFGELPSDCPRRHDSSYVAWIARDLERHPFDEGRLFVCMEHAFHHINWAWNCRHAPEDRIWNFTERDANRWTKFPDAADFADLWPQDRTIRFRKDDCELFGSSRRISLSPVRLGIQMANRKLDILCYLVAKELGNDLPQRIVRPKGLKAEVDQQPLTEKAFARRLRQIYVELNMAWNGRRDKTFVTNKRAICRRLVFSPSFATGCHNMWRTRSKICAVATGVARKAR
jgi:hypothetical protein